MTRVPDKTARKAKKGAPAVSARPRVRRVNVAHPTVPGAVESVDRIVDGTANIIEGMFKRQQIDANQRRAAERLRLASETVNGSVGGVMDMDKVRGAGLPGAPPPDPYMRAAKDVNDARYELYALDFRVIHLVVCEGYRVDSAAAIIFGRDPTRAEKERAGERLREGLRELAMLWYPSNDGEQDGMRSFHTPDADPKHNSFTAKAGRRDINVDHAHAAGRKIFREGR